MGDIENMDEIYELLEKINTQNFYEIRRVLNNYLKKNHENKKILCEYTCLEFRIIDGKIKGVFSCQKDGEIIDIPNLDQLTKEDFKYIGCRIKNTDNDLLKFRYSTILCTKYPHQNKAKLVIDSSWRLICNLEQKILKNNKSDSFFMTTIVNSYRFSFSFGYKKDRIKNKIIELINCEDFWNENLYLIPYGLINHVLNEKKNFKELDNLNEICWNIYNNIKSIHSQKVINLLELGEKCDLKDKKYNWRLEIARIHEKDMNESEDAIKAYHCLNAIKNYKQAGETSKSEELLGKYREFSQYFDYNEYHQEIENWSEIVEQLREDAEKFVDQNDSKNILMYLMNDYRLTKHHKCSLSFAEFSKNNSPLLHALSIGLHDENGFLIKKIRPGVESDNHATMKHYNLLIQFAYLPFITQIIDSSYITGKLSPKIILEFLRDETWLGYDEIQGVGKNDFLPLIVPIINNYFHEWELLYLYNIPYPNFSLFIDSLILKIEGILKVIYSIENEIKETTEEISIQDKSLNKILEDENFNLISEDDIFFLRYLLIDKSGLNLRNKVAHSLMKKEEYYLGNANLLLLALLKLCSFQLKFKTKDDMAE